MDASRLEAGEDANVDFVEGASIHLAQNWHKKIQPRVLKRTSGVDAGGWERRHFLGEGPLEGLLANGASGEDLLDLLEALKRPETLPEFGEGSFWASVVEGGMDGAD